MVEMCTKYPVTIYVAGSCRIVGLPLGANMDMKNIEESEKKRSRQQTMVAEGDAKERGRMSWPGRSYW